MKVSRKLFQLDYYNSYDDGMALSQRTILFETKDDAKQWLKDDEIDEVFLEDLALAMDENDEPLFSNDELTEISPDFDPDDYYPDRGQYDYGWHLSEVEVLTKD